MYYKVPQNIQLLCANTIMESVKVFPKAAQLYAPGISAIGNQYTLLLGQSTLDKKKQ